MKTTKVFFLPMPLSIAAILLLITSISAQQIDSYGLEGKSVTCLAVRGEDIYAGTDREGVFKKALHQLDSGWEYLGLPGTRINAIFPYEVDASRLALIVGVTPNYSSGDSTLVYQRFPEAREWLPYDSGMTHGQYAHVSSFDALPGNRYVFAGGVGTKGGAIYRLANTSWEKALDRGFEIFSVNVVRVDPKAQVIWAGGQLAVMSPYLARSTDGGSIWELISPFFLGDNTCLSLVTHPEDTNTVYACLEGAVLKTTNGGKDWSVSLSASGSNPYEIIFRGVGIDSRNANHIYAGGDSARYFAFYETFDGGNSWQRIPPPATSRDFLGVTSIAVDPDSGNVVYIATLGNGVVRYRSIITGIVDTAQDPQESFLYQNFPNPFNSRTLIEFSTRRSKARVTLTIYDIFGREVITLEDKPMAVGYHRVEWNGKTRTGGDVASGIYFYRMIDGAQTQLRKMVLIR